MQFTKIKPFFLVTVLLGSLLGGFELQAQKNDYIQKLSKLNTLEDRISKHQESLRALVRAKRETQSKDKQAELARQMVITHDYLKQDVTEYNKLRIEVKYRYPNKGQASKNRYVPLKAEPIEHFENESQLDHVLSEVKREVDQKYAPFTRKETPKQQALSRNKAGQKMEREPASDQEGEKSFKTTPSPTDPGVRLRLER